MALTTELVRAGKSRESEFIRLGGPKLGAFIALGIVLAGKWSAGLAVAAFRNLP
jgi:hypothetical protein